MIPDDVVEQVREHADIVSIVGELVKLKRVGSSFRGPCPFHQGKDANFAVSPRGGGPWTAARAADLLRLVGCSRVPADAGERG